MKKITCVLLLFLAICRLPLKADEGMWLPFLIDEALYEEMSRMGLNLEPEEIFSFNEPSIKDAIVSFGGFCTGEIISDQGLVLTNHHCGRGRIQSHSSVENDLLTDGFWAMSKEEELPNEGLFVRFLVNVDDVTEDIQSVIQPGMNEVERAQAIRAKGKELAESATEGTHYTADVSSMFAGNYFYLFTYETFHDVRLVGAPPQSIGAFGGDTDNWEWPRHTGDFSLFRVYTAPDGSPAEYSEENIPLQPRHHLPVSLKGVEENDFAMVLGYPGSTERYLTSYGVDYRLENMYPVRIDIRRRKLDILEEAMASSDEIRIQYTAKHSSIANYWKNFIGMSESLKRLNVADSKRELEDEFAAWVTGNPERQEEYGHVIDDFRKVYEGLKAFNSHNYVFAEAMPSGPDVIGIANRFNRLNAMLGAEEVNPANITDEIKRLSEMADALYKDYNKGVDQQLWAAMFEVYAEYIPEEDLPGIFTHLATDYGNDYESYAHDVYEASIFADKESMQAFLENPDAEELAADPAFRAVRSVYEKYREINQGRAEYNNLLRRAERDFLRGLMEMKPEDYFYPDANSTMRFTYGSVNGYEPRDAVYYDYTTTLEGVMEKKDPEDSEFVVPEKLEELYKKEDYGPYAHEKMIVNFISNNDITGGNSGSPVINADGHLIGVAFDANWEGMSGDILFEHDLQKCINADARYMLFVIDKFAGASHLIEEMTIVE